MSAISRNIEAARVAGAEWAKTSPRQRRKVLSRFARVLAEHQDELVSAIVRDVGKPALDALGGDVLVTLEHMRYYQRRAHKLLESRRVGRDWLLFGGTKFTKFYEPYGVVLVFGPSNYPLQLGLVPAVAALYAGNAVVAKLSERATALCTMLRDLIAQANFPCDLLQIVSEVPETGGEYIDAHPDFIFFTGSSANGVRVAECAAKQMIPAVFELGGKDAGIVFDDCDFERTVEGVLYGAFSNSGQVCVGIKRLFVESPIFHRFLDHLCTRVDQLRIGTSTDGDCDLTPFHEGPVASHLASQISDALRRGARVLTRSTDHTGAVPIILAEVPRDANLLVEESFGPVLCIEPFQTEAEVIEAANDSRFALGASIWTRDSAKAYRVAMQLGCANVAVNDVIRNIANPAAPFGGNQASGYGRYHGPEGLYAFSRIKTIMLSKSRARSERNWFPFTSKTYLQLRRLIQLRHLGVRSFFRCLIFIFSLLSASALGQQAGHLHIRITLPPQSRGQIAYLIFKSPEGFPNNKAKAIRDGFLPLNVSASDIDLGELASGRYAVSLYLDENFNHKLDTKLLGIPKEPVGASRNPKARMGPPKFEDSAFEMPDKDLTLEIRMVRP